MNRRLYIIAIALYILIGILFIEKYALRFTSVAVTQVMAIGYASVVVLAYAAIKRVIMRRTYKAYWAYGLCIILGGIAIAAQYCIDPMTIQVDRWSAIHNFIQGMFHGVYPYGCQTHLGGYGSPFPVWQLFHIPFYLLGNVGLSIFFVSGLFLWTLHRCHSIQTMIVALALMFLSPCYWYEILVRSDLMTNILLAAVVVEWLAYKEVHLSQHFLLIACISGLLLSTRFCAVIPLCVLYGYEFLHLTWKKQVLFLLTSIGIFALTFLPFVLWEGSTLLFFKYNPFVLQTRQGSIYPKSVIRE